jgi:hypothetical protein
MTESKKTEEEEVATTTTNEQESEPLHAAKPLAKKQMQQRRRYPPRAPGFFPPAADIVITMSLRLAVVITDFIVIVTSFAYDGAGVGLLIVLEIAFTYIGFAYFVRKISRQILVYKRFFMKLNAWYSRRYDALTDGANNCLCCCFKFVLLNVCWWTAALLLFPIIIGWSMKQSYSWYQDRRRNAHSEVDLTQLENAAASTRDARQYWKMTDNAYSVWHLGVLTKQASMVVLFIENIPLLVLSLIASNYIGIAVYVVAITLKLLFWFKHMYDLGRCTLFYDAEHYLDHFGIKSISWDHEYGCNIILATFYTPYEHEMSTLQVGDWVALYEEQHQEWTAMIVLESRHLKEKENLVLVNYLKVDKKAIEDYEKGLAKKILVPPDLIRVVNRWDGNVELLRDDDYEEYHDRYVYGEPDHEEEEEEEEKEKEKQEAVDVVVIDANSRTELENVSVAGNAPKSGSEINHAPSTEVAVTEDTDTKHYEHVDDANEAAKNPDKTGDALLEDAVVVEEAQ